MRLVYKTARNFFLSAILAGCAGSWVHGETSARELVEKSNELLRGPSSRSRIVMKIRTPRWERTLEIEAWNHGKNKALIKILSPAKERGNGTLKLNDQIWNWLPAVERSIKIQPTMLQASWMGSDFNFEDMVKGDSIVRDYDHKIVEQKEEGGGIRFQVEAVPKPDEAAGWGKVLLTFSENQGDVLPLMEEDFSADGEKLRTLKFLDAQLLGGRRIPTRIECVQHKREGQKSILTYKEFEPDVSFESDFFSLATLQKPVQ